MTRKRRSPPAGDRRDFEEIVSADGFDAEEDNPNPQNIQPPLVVIDPARFPILATHWPSVPPNWLVRDELTERIVQRLPEPEGKAA